jgi:hypothetical protein
MEINTDFSKRRFRATVNVEISKMSSRANKCERNEPCGVGLKSIEGE